jgi:DNA-binding NarL/FixJ family response regulator
MIESAPERRARILVIDDEEQIRRALKSVLQARHYEVELAATAEAGIEATAEHTPDAIILDLTLPGMSGFEACRQLREWYDGPILVLSVRADDEDKISALDLGADDYLTKPVGKADLLNAIRSRLQRADQQTKAEFNPDFSSAKPLEKVLDLTPRVAETLLWIAQGKTNGDIASILGISEATVKKHVLEIFQALSVETRTAASLRALEVLSSPSARK